MPHTPLKRTCLPVPPLRHVQAGLSFGQDPYFLSGFWLPPGAAAFGAASELAGADAPVPAAPFEAAGDAAGFAPAGAEDDAPGEPDVVGDTEAAGETDGTAPVSGRLAGACCGAELFVIPWPRLFLSKRPGIENKKATTKKTIAAPTVTFASTVCVPRGPNAVELAPPPKIAEASDLPGCNRTNRIRIKQDRI